MTGEKRILELIRDDLALLPDGRREAVEHHAKQFRLALSAGGTLAKIALAWVAAEQAALHEDDFSP